MNVRGKIIFLRENAFRLVKPERSLQRFGPLTTIYSVGLFDYVETDKLVRLLAALYESLATGSVLIGSFKDRYRYDTFDYYRLKQFTFA